MDFRKTTSTELVKEFIRVRMLTIEVLDQFKKALGPSLRVTDSPIINNPRWEFSHVAWFSERWILRNKEINYGLGANLKQELLPDEDIKPYLTDADRLFDSATILHHERWKTHMPDYHMVKNYLKSTLEKIISKIEKENPKTKEECYFYRLSLAHEYMHLEAFIMTAQTLNFTLFDCYRKLTEINFIKEKKLLEINSTVFAKEFSSHFFFDNETLQLETVTKPFEIDSSPISLGKLMKFAEFGGYENKSLWSVCGWNWLLNNKNKTFISRCSKTKDGMVFLKKWFGKKHLVNNHFPAIHVSYYEAEAFCFWANRRLPTESEWMAASKNSGFYWGNVWEWTNNIFKSYENFRPHPYEEYSKPWFNNHQVVKGSSFATQEQFKNLSFRNFYQRHRNDVFIGFRTVKDLT